MVCYYMVKKEYTMQSMWRSCTPKLVQELWICRVWQPVGKQICGFGMWTCMMYDNTTKESHCFKSFPNYKLIIFPSHICNCWWTSVHWLVYWVIAMKFSKYYNYFTLIIPMCKCIVIVGLAIWCCNVTWLVLIIVSFKCSRKFSVHWTLV
jgi:hypothetical protein